MDVDQHARTTPRGRLLMLRRLAGGWTVAAVAAAAGVTAKTVARWRDRHAKEGAAGLADRSSRPHHGPTRLAATNEDEILDLRRQRWFGPAIASRLGRPAATVGLVLRRHGLGRLAALQPRPEIVRYPRPGELIHPDIKKPGRIDGVGHRPRHGRSVTAGACPERRTRGSACRSHAFRQAVQDAGFRHKRTRPYTPQTIDSRAVDPIPQGTARQASRRAKPNGSSRPACVNGPTGMPSTAPLPAPRPCAPGSTATTAADRTQPLAESHPSPD